MQICKEKFLSIILTYYTNCKTNKILICPCHFNIPEGVTAYMQIHGMYVENTTSLVILYGRRDVLRFYILFNIGISVTSGQWADDNERLSAMQPCLPLRRFRLEGGQTPGH